MAKKPLPCTTVLRQLLRYEPDTGKLFWRERGVEWFSDGYRTAEGNCAGWNAKYQGKEAFTALSHGYLHGALFRSNFPAHRVVWAIYHGTAPIGDIDHINGVITDNRIVNLRDVTKSQNMRNQKRHSSNTSGHTGVTWNADRKKWQAQINVNHKGNYLGLFDDLADAIVARKAAERNFGFHPNHGRD